VRCRVELSLGSDQHKLVGGPVWSSGVDGIFFFIKKGLFVCSLEVCTTLYWIDFELLASC
jgi:hypothetical protein